MPPSPISRRSPARRRGAGFARLSDAEIGGLHLERLHRRGTIRYTMLVFEQPYARGS